FGSAPKRVRQAWSLTTAVAGTPATSSSGENQRPCDALRASKGKDDALANSTNDCLIPELVSAVTVLLKTAAALANTSRRSAIARYAGNELDSGAPSSE